MAMIAFATWLLIGSAGLSVAYGHAASVASQDEHPDAIFYNLARRDIANDVLITALAEWADLTALTEKFQLYQHLASPLTSSEQETLKRSLVNTIKYIVVEVAPKEFWEHQVAAHYASALSPTEAREILGAYDELEDRPAGRKLKAVRESFWEDHFPNVLPEIRSWSRSFSIPSPAMMPSLLPGDNILVNKSAYKEALPQRGDVIVFQYPEDETKLFVKRVIGRPGDVIEVRNQLIYLNGDLFPEDYIQHTDRNILASNPRDNLKAVTVPPDSYFVLGDNRESSLDSRFWGYVARKKILGKAVLIYFSADRTSKTVRWDRLGLPVR